MSRAYRIQVRESVRRVIHAEDHVSTQLELLEILPCDQMGALLGQELASRGFHHKEGKAVRNADDVEVTVDLDTGEVTVQAAERRDVELEAEREGHVYDDVGPDRQSVEERLRENLRTNLEKNIDKQSSELQKQTTEKLEAQLAELKSELDQAVNRATAAALKIKAQQLGQVKEITEDPASGSLTIVVEV
jgi:hypothetical protein